MLAATRKRSIKEEKNTSWIK